MPGKPSPVLQLDTLEDRLTPTLALDPAFGVGGRTFVTPGPVALAGTTADAVVRPDGKVWTLGTLGGNAVLARFNPNGELDPTFDGDGIAPVLPWSRQVQSVYLTKLALQADGRLVLAGTAYTTFSSGGETLTGTKFLAVRVNEDGTLDASFGDGGRVLADTFGDARTSAASLFAAGVTGDGRVVLAGTATMLSVPTPGVPSQYLGDRLVAVRLTPDGRLDAGYDGDGRAVVTDVGGGPSSLSSGAAAVGADGGVVFARPRYGAYDPYSGGRREVYLGASVLAADGSADVAFNGTGYAESAVLPPPSGDVSYSVYASDFAAAVQPGGRVLIAATAVTTTADPDAAQVDRRNRTVVVGFTADGRQDATFADGGILSVADTAADGNDSLSLFDVLPDGRFVANAYTVAYENGLARYTNDFRGYTADGRPDAAFGPDGRLPNVASAVRGETIFPAGVRAAGGGLIAFGTTEFYPASGFPLSVRRIGLVRLADDPPAVPPTADNQNVVGAFAAAPRDPDAALDPAFAGGRPVYLSSTLGPVGGVVYATAVDAEGRSLVLMRLYETVLARFTPTGQLDTTFDGDGVRTVETGTVGENHLLVQPDGKIVYLGVRPEYGSFGLESTTVVVRRMNADGSDDATFGTAGVVTLDSARPIRNEFGFELTRLADGRLQILNRDASPYTDEAERSEFLARRLTAAGQLDTTFGEGGVVRVTADLNRLRFGGYTSLPDGSMVAFGTRRTYSTTTDAPVPVYAVALRLTPTGEPDPAFGSGGYAETLLETFTVPAGANNLVAASAPVAAVQPGGGIVVGVQLERTYTRPSGADPAVSETVRDARFDLVRFTPTGQPDAAFGDGGRTPLDAQSQTTTGGTKYRRYVSLLTLPDGGLSLLSSAEQYSPTVVDDVPLWPAGTAGLSPPQSPVTISVAVRRFTAAGRPDLGFGTLGDVTLAVSPTDRYSFVPNTQAVDAAGRVILGGGSDAGGGLERIAPGVLAAAARPAVYVSGANGTVEGFRRSAAGTLASAGTVTPFADYAGPVRVATGDLNGDGLPDTIYATGDRGSKVRVVFGTVPDTSPAVPLDVDVFEAGFDGGVSVAAGDADGDGRAEFAVTPNVGGSGRVVVYSLVDGRLVVRANFFGIDDQSFRGGATAAFGDTDGDGRAELVVAAGVGGGPRVAVFRGATLFAGGAAPPKLVNDFFAFPGPDAETLRNGVSVAAGDATGDGVADLVFGGGPGGAPRVYALDGKAFSAGAVVPVANFFAAGDAASREGVRLAFKDLDGDGRAELIANAAGPTSRAYRGTTLAQPNAAEPTVYEDFDSTAAAGAALVYVG